MMTVKEKLEKARQAKVLKKQQGLSVSKLNFVEKWEKDKTSLRKSINAKCLDCCCGDKSEVVKCTVQVCPLWFVRPGVKHG